MPSRLAGLRALACHKQFTRDQSASCYHPAETAPEEIPMKWTPGGTSQDVEDRRDEGGGGGGFQFGGMHLGIGGALILLVLSLVFKQNFFALLGNGVAGPSSPAMCQTHAGRGQQEQRQVHFFSFDLTTLHGHLLKLIH